MSDRRIAMALFAGIGWLSTGLVKAIIDIQTDMIARETGFEANQITLGDPHVHRWLGENVELHTVNQWEPPIATHDQNHPRAEHYHAKIQELHLSDVVSPGDVNLLVGGPSCPIIPRHAVRNQ